MDSPKLSHRELCSTEVQKVLLALNLGLSKALERTHGKHTRNRHEHFKHRHEPLSFPSDKVFAAERLHVQLNGHFST